MYELLALTDALRMGDGRTRALAVCRWRHARRSLLLDAMPVDPAILGLANGWHAAAMLHAARTPFPRAR